MAEGGILKVSSDPEVETTTEELFAGCLFGVEIL
jgi:hypothetical protein